jgi:hypothetical protein
MYVGDMLKYQLPPKQDPERSPYLRVYNMTVLPGYVSIGQEEMGFFPLISTPPEEIQIWLRVDDGAMT